MAIVLGGAAALGKIVGGIAADRIGWRLWSVGALVAVSAMLWRASSDRDVLLIETLLVQAAMAVTLAAIFRVMPRRPGLAFGLASTAILLGATNVYGYRGFIHIPWGGWLWALVAASAALVWVGLTLQRGPRPGRPTSPLSAAAS